MSSVREAAEALLNAIQDEASKGTVPTSVILAALAMRPALEADTVEVPTEPTEAMIEAGWAVEELQTPERVYRAMIAAAHEPEAREGEG